MTPAGSLPGDPGDLFADARVVMTHEGREFYRGLAADVPEAYLDRTDLASAVANWAVEAAQVGLIDQSIAFGLEAVDGWRLVAAAHPGEVQPGLAASLFNLSGILSNAGRPREGLMPAMEGAGLYRQLAEADPAHWNHTFAMVHTKLSSRFTELGELHMATEPAYLAVSAYHQLTPAEQASVAPDLAPALANLGGRKAQQGDIAEAAIPAGAAIEIYRALERFEPGVHTVYYAHALAGYSAMLDDLGRRDEAVLFVQEAAQLGPVARAGLN